MIDTSLHGSDRASQKMPPSIIRFRDGDDLILMGPSISRGLAEWAKTPGRVGHQEMLAIEYSFPLGRVGPNKMLPISMRSSEIGTGDSQRGL